MGLIFLYLILFQIKHFVCDYPLQTEYMLGKFKEKGWVIPLSLHAGVHAIATLALIYPFGQKIALYMAGLDFVIHFIMDRVKASPKMLGRFSSMTKNEYIAMNRLVDRAVKEDAIYDCSRHETRLNEMKKSNKYFWWSLGLDQGVHHLTHYLIIFIALT